MMCSLLAPWGESSDSESEEISMTSGLLGAGEDGVPS
jgi:hypothetical protein